MLNGMIIGAGIFLGGIMTGYVLGFIHGSAGKSLLDEGRSPVASAEKRTAELKLGRSGPEVVN